MAFTLCKTTDKNDVDLGSRFSVCPPPPQKNLVSTHLSHIASCSLKKERKKKGKKGAVSRLTLLLNRRERY